MYPTKCDKEPTFLELNYHIVIFHRAPILTTGLIWYQQRRNNILISPTFAHQQPKCFLLQFRILRAQSHEPLKNILGDFNRFQVRHLPIFPSIEVTNTRRLCLGARIHKLNWHLRRFARFTRIRILRHQILL